jgi:hypothetical protein
MNKGSMTDHQTITELAFLKRSKVMSTTKLELAVKDKMNERFKQTFVKQDIFSRKKTKLTKPNKI